MTLFFYLFTIGEDMFLRVDFFVSKFRSGYFQKYPCSISNFQTTSAIHEKQGTNSQYKKYTPSQKQLTTHNCHNNPYNKYPKIQKKPNMHNHSNSRSYQHSNPKPSTSKPHAQKTTHNLYNIVMNYHKYTQIPEFKKQQQILRKFVENAKQKVLFVFGPSGCGKHMFVNNFLGKHGIPYNYRAERIQQNLDQFEIDQQYQPTFQNQQTTKIKSLKNLITQSITKTAINKIQVYEDFPTAQQSSSRDLEQIKQFKQNFYKTIQKFQCKLIFLLNSDIYNKYFIVPKDGVDGVCSIVLKSYSITEAKCILKQFVREHYVFEWVMKSKDILDEILQISNGDMRKILLNVYRYTIDSDINKIQYLNKNEKMQYKLKLKNQQKFPLFHLLGKYLYAKRYDKYQKKDRTFTRKQLLEDDPPFYFNPVDMFYKSNVPINTFTDLLFQNYPVKINSLQDAIQISQMFSSLDSLFPAYIGSKRIDNNSEQSQRMYMFVLTWGIILKNKSSAQVEKKFSNFRKAEFKVILNQMNSKRTLLRTYFPYSSMSSLVRWGHIVKNIKPSKKYLISDLIGRRTRINNFLRDENQKAMGQEQEQELIKEEIHDSGNNFIRNYTQKALKKEKQRKFLKEIQMDDQSDIDD